MKNTPILLSAPMVRALLDGTKTQTRRIVKPQPERREIEQVGYMLGFKKRQGDGFWLWPNARWKIMAECPYGQPGDRLYVRETYFAWGRWETRYSPKKKRDEWHFVDMTVESGRPYLFAADDLDGCGPKQAKRRGGVEPMYWKRPAIFMPRVASRIILEITGVRVERLQDISEADALAEGVECDSTIDYRSAKTDDRKELHSHAVDQYRSLWESINGPGSWDSNPWVWALSFKRVTP